MSETSPGQLQPRPPHPAPAAPPVPHDAGPAARAAGPTAMWCKGFYRKGAQFQNGVVVLMRREMVFIPTDAKKNLAWEMTKATGSAVTQVQVVSFGGPGKGQPIEPWVAYLHAEHGEHFAAYVRRLAQERGGGSWTVEQADIEAVLSPCTKNWTPIFVHGDHRVTAVPKHGAVPLFHWLLYEWVHLRQPAGSAMGPVSLRASRPIAAMVFLMALALFVAGAFAYGGLTMGGTDERVLMGVAAGIAGLVFAVFGYLLIDLLRRPGPVLSPPAGVEAAGAPDGADASAGPRG